MLQLIILSMIGRLLELVEITIYFKSIFVFQTILLSIFELLMILNILKGSIDYLELNYEGNLSLELEKKEKNLCYFRNSYDEYSGFHVVFYW